MNVSYKNLTTFLVVCAVMVTMVTLAGCKKESEPTLEDVTSEVRGAAEEVIAQTTCPVMGGKINKNIFVEYKGKKVYFCCPGCVGSFAKDREKYVSKLPQFND